MQSTQTNYNFLYYIMDHWVQYAIDKLNPTYYELDNKLTKTNIQGIKYTTII